MDIPWGYIQRHFDWLGHVVEGFCIAAVVALLFMVVAPRRLALIIGLAFAAGHFHGREKRDFEISANLQPPHLEGYKMWKWSWDQATDFWPTALVLVCVIFALLPKWRRKPGSSDD
ncbi:hypothetical protein C7U60_09355 [Mesorhizobium plurifarium]|uniref:hypothetical protein n=1 Tax=Sinorhizobium arboris TaxID=76745 RepID=UPI000486F407|nr:hypothetical protein [Sinorhizobium arboris]PST24229.1 hypothetical protein C7U60_09355 [Mesorhizobium plurifarium]